MNTSIVKQAVFSTLVQTLMWAGMLLLPAMTLDWPRAWIFLGVAAALSAATILIVFPGNEALLAERYKPPIQKGQPLSDKILVSAYLLMFAAIPVCAARDVFYWHVWPKPLFFVSIAGLLLFVAGWVIISMVFRENTFAAVVVKHQKERAQTVVSTGPYAVVRHPMYTGASLLLFGLPLWLESYFACALAVLPMLILAVRIVFEERFLVTVLEGYPAYREKVRYRLCPGIW